jgi:uncharacterized protein DUF3352
MDRALGVDDHGGMSLRLAPILLAAALLTAGCGADRTAASAGPSAARAIPDHPLVVVDVNLDRGSAAWRAAEAVGARFPHWRRLVARIHRSLDHTSGGMRYDRDIAPWLGSEAAIAVTGVNLTDSAHPVDVVAFVAVTDRDRLESELRSHHGRQLTGYHGADQFRDTQDGSYAAVTDHALLLANTLPALHAAEDALRGAAPRLSDDPRYRAAMAQLPRNSLVTAYADGGRLGQLLSLAELAPTFPAAERVRLATLASTLHAAGSFTASLGAEPGGVRLTFNATPAPGASLPAAEARPQGPPPLVGRVPAGAFAYLGALGSASSTAVAGNPASLRAFSRLTGLSYARDVAPLLSGGYAAYAAPGMPVSAALLFQPRDPTAATTAMRHVTAALSRLDRSIRVRPLPAGTGQELVVAPGPPIEWRRLGGIIAVSNDPAAGRPQTDDLETSPAWRSLAAQAHVPAHVGFLAYLGIHQLLRLMTSAPDPDTDHLDGLVMWTTSGPSGAHFEAYLQVLR